MIDIKDEALHWACEYEPGLDVDATPSRHARWGFEAGAAWMQRALGLEKITIINVDDYQAIYNGDKLIHYEDGPIGGAFLDLLGIDNEELYPEDLGLMADDFDQYTAPATLTELRQMGKDIRQESIKARLDDARQGVAEIEQELADLKWEDDDA